MRCCWGTNGLACYCRKTMGLGRTTIVIAALIAIAAVAVEAGAQPLVGATVGISRQGEGDSDQPYLGPPFGGTSLATVFMLDVPVGTHGQHRRRSQPGRVNQRPAEPARHRLYERGVREPASRHDPLGRSQGGNAVRRTRPRGRGRRLRRRVASDVALRHRRAKIRVDQHAAVRRAADDGGAGRAGSAPTCRCGSHRRCDSRQRPRERSLRRRWSEDGVVRRGVSSLVVRVGAGIQIGF